MFYVNYCYILLVYSFCAGVFTLFIYLHQTVDVFSAWLLRDFEQPLNFSYDYIVVGAGTAGSLVAARLAEDADISVLVLEAGGSPSPLFDIPLAAPMLQMTPYDWQYKTEPQRSACFGLNDKVSPWPRGKILGGSGRLNYMVYLRGHRNDYGTWPSDENEDWSYNEVLRYFKKSEKQHGRFKNSANHGNAGVMPVSDLRIRSEFAEAVVSAGEELGYKRVDLNSGNATGFMEVQTMTFNGSRFSTDRLLLDKKNIRVLTNAHVMRVLLKKGYEAKGVEYWRGGRSHIVKAKKGVILSAGTVATPQILMLSGIGPKKHIQSHKIKSVNNLPVGDNLLDHVTTGLDIITLNSSSPIWHTTMTNPMYALQYFLNSEGPFTSPGCESAALIKTSLAKASDPPDIQIMSFPAGLSTDAGVVLRRAMGFNQVLWKKYFSNLVGRSVGSLLVALLHPKSKGTIRLRSSNPFDPPVINPNYLKHPDDLLTLSKGMEFIEKLIKTKAMKKVNGKLNNQPLPGCESFQFATISYWACYVRHMTLTAYHPVGTSKMGLKNDPTTVVDTTLRVRNTNRLFVVDASVMPTMTSGNINSVVLMIAEKAADIIKRIWYLQQAHCHIKDILLSPKFTHVIS
ncbi:hypothetical protein LSTR_LSTR009991 [Laodelphax striatellus]|uniref:Glucose-methanol-choline oxidoreductase N-terminal domain-containing protein n=1 Tax=Laodelphax striatellus TaxID=195883 RepID=A0A482WXJ9_LAOST|nr:hypothetical protein LSTR_LSTR009991 [Laodelphax striatellus]